MSSLLDLSGFDATKSHKVRMDYPGKATLLLTAVSKEPGKDGKGPSLKCSFDILAHENTDAIGEEHVQWMPLTTGMAEYTLKLAYALGIHTPEEVTAAIASGSFELNLEAGVSRAVCAAISKKDNYRAKFWDSFALDHPAAEDFPKPNGASARPAAPPAPKGAEIVDPPAPAADAEDDIPF